MITYRLLLVGFVIRAKFLKKSRTEIGSVFILLAIGVGIMTYISIKSACQTFVKQLSDNGKTKKPRKRFVSISVEEQYLSKVCTPYIDLFLITYGVPSVQVPSFHSDSLSVTCRVQV